MEFLSPGTKRLKLRRLNPDDAASISALARIPCLHVIGFSNERLGMVKAVRNLIVIFLIVAGPSPQADAATDYQLRDLDGKLHRVSDYRGKWLIINFWATWCRPCLQEMPELERFYQQNGGRAQVWGVTFEDNDKARILEFVEALGVSYPILGHGQDPLTGYGSVTVLPTTFIIDRNGLFFHRFEGPISAQDIVDVIE